MLTAPQRRRRRRNIKKLTIPMIPQLMKNLLLILIVYLFLMLRLKMVLNLIMIMRRMILLYYKKKKHLTNAKDILKKILLEEIMGRKDNLGYRNQCPSQL